MNQFIKFVFSFSAVTFPINAVAAIVVGNGTELISTAENPWFVGSKPISYCIQSVDETPQFKKELSQLVSSAISQWTKTVSILKPNAVSTSYYLQSDTRNISLNYNEQPCHPETEVEFLFGVDTPETKKISQTNDEHYAGAYAVRKTYDPLVGRAKGFVWINEQVFRLYSTDGVKRYSATAKALKPIVLHEVGHIFGFSHRDRGAMSKSALFNSADDAQISYSPKKLTQLVWANTGEKACGTISWFENNVPAGALENFRSFQNSVCIQKKENFVYLMTPGETPVAYQVISTIPQTPELAVAGLFRAQNPDGTPGFFPQRGDLRHRFIQFDTPCLLTRNQQDSLLKICTDLKNASLVIDVVQDKKFFTANILLDF